MLTNLLYIAALRVLDGVVWFLQRAVKSLKSENARRQNTQNVPEVASSTRWTFCERIFYGAVGYLRPDFSKECNLLHV